ncbi:centromere protein M [Pelodytes ibericus]
MSHLRPFDKMPILNTAAVLLVGSEESGLEQVANAMLKKPKNFEVKIHMAQTLPLHYESEHLRPRFDLVVFVINLHSLFSLSAVVNALSHLDSNFYLGKVCFLATGGGHVKNCVVEISVVKKLADIHQSILLLSQLSSEEDVSYAAQRLVHMLQICAGLVPGVSALSLGSLFKCSSNVD